MANNSEQSTENCEPSKGEDSDVVAVFQALEGQELVSKQQVLEKVQAHEEIHCTKEKTVNLWLLFEQIGTDEFESMISSPVVQCLIHL